MADDKINWKFMAGDRWLHFWEWLGSSQGTLVMVVVGGVVWLGLTIWSVVLPLTFGMQEQAQIGARVELDQAILDKILAGREERLKNIPRDWSFVDRLFVAPLADDQPQDITGG